MAGGIFLVGEGGKLVEMNEQPYNLEDDLQQLLEKYPNLLPGSQIDPEAPRRWLLVSREVGIPGEEDAGDRWSLDHLFLDQDGVPTLVEAKRRSNPEIRRKIVGQMLDYAANAIAFWPVEAIRAKFESRCERDGLDPLVEIQKLTEEEGDAEAFWSTVRTNLQAGKVRLLFVADEIPVELRRIVEFLNKQMDPAEVLAVEIRQFKSDEGQLALVPLVIGHVASKEQKRTTTVKREKIDEATYLSAMEEQQGSFAADVARKLIAWAKDRGLEPGFTKGTADARFNPALKVGDKAAYPISLRTNRFLKFQIHLLKDHPPCDDEAVRLEWLNKLNKMGTDFPPEKIDGKPSIPVDLLANESNMSALLDALNWLVDQFKKA